MNPIVFTILAWEKELDDQRQALIHRAQHENLIDETQAAAQPRREKRRWFSGRSRSMNPCECRG